MNNLTDFENTEDVSDAEIEWVLRETDSSGWSAYSVREGAAQGYPGDRARILAARLIQRHHPELLVDPDLLEVREIAAKYWEANGSHIRAEGYRAGAKDDWASAKIALDALKRGRELEQMK